MILPSLNLRVLSSSDALLHALTFLRLPPPSPCLYSLKMAKGKGASSTSNPNIEWVTLISKDNYQFVIDKRFALRSIFIRSMLGESRTSNMARRGQKAAAKVNTVNASASELLEVIPNGTSFAPTEGDDAANLDSMNGRATPPPQESNTAANGADPDGYVNPFASNAGVGEDEADSDVELPFENGFAEAQTSIVKFPNIRGIILEKVVEYLCWNARYFNAKDIDIPDFQHRIKPEIAVEL